MAHDDAVAPTILAARAAGARGLAEIAQFLNERGIPTVRGGKWRTETVRRVMKRLNGRGHAEFVVRSRSIALSDNARERYQRYIAARALIREQYERMKAAQQHAAPAEQSSAGGSDDNRQ